MKSVGEVRLSGGSGRTLSVLPEHSPLNELLRQLRLSKEPFVSEGPLVCEPLGCRCQRGRELIRAAVSQGEVGEGEQPSSSERFSHTVL